LYKGTLLSQLEYSLLKEENMLMSVGYKQTDSSFGNFLDVDGRVMIDFGRVVPCEPGPEVDHPEEVF